MSFTGLRASAGKRTLAFGLVHINVGLMPMFDDPKDARPTRNNICPEHKLQVTQSWNCPHEKGHVIKEATKAVRVGDTFVEIEDSEWDALKAFTDSTIRLQAWVESISTYFYEKAFFIFPQEEKDAEAYMILLQTLAAEGGSLIGVTPGDNGTTKVFAVSYCAELRCLSATVCRHASYFRASQARVIGDRLADHEVDPEAVGVAIQILGQLPTSFDLKEIPDTLGDAQRALIQSKIDKTQAAAPESVLHIVAESENLMDALRNSIKPSKKKVAKTTTNKRERVRA